MSLGEVWRRLLYLVRRDRALSELEEEMRMHLELRARQISEDTPALDSAATRARRQFGSNTSWVERSRDEWGGLRLESLWKDIGYAQRTLRVARGHTLAVVLTLGVVIGSCTAVFSIVHALFLQRLTLSQPAQLVSVRAFVKGRAAAINATQYAALVESPGVSRMAAYRFDPITVESDAGREDVWADFVTGDYFATVGASPFAGRVLNTEDAAAAVPVIIISHDVAVRHFRSAADAVGRTIYVEGAALTVVGVMSPAYTGIQFARTFSAAIPLAAASALGLGNANSSLYLVGRVNRGARAAAEQALTVTYRNCCLAPRVAGAIAEAARQQRRALSTEAPTGESALTTSRRDPHIQLADASRGVTWGRDYRAEYRAVVAASATGVVILLLIACANIATLLMARALTREKEFAIRRVMGAGSFRLLRQLLSENMLLACLGGVLGFAIGVAQMKLLLQNLPTNAIPIADVLRSQSAATIFAITGSCTVLSMLCFGIWPARESVKRGLRTPLTGDDRGVRRLLKSGRALVGIQMALTLVLVSSATLFAVTIRNLLNIEVSASASELVLARVDADATRFRAEGVLALSEALRSALESVPEVKGAAVMLDAPLLHDFVATWAPGRRGEAADASNARTAPYRLNPVSDGYFAVTGIRLRAGREFTQHDRSTSEPVAIVSAAMARDLFGEADPIGEILRLDTRKEIIDIRIVGVAADVPYDDPRSALPLIWYVPLSQARAWGNRVSAVPVVIRTAGDARHVMADARLALESAIAGLRVTDLATAANVLDETLARERFAAMLAAVFGCIALIIAATGVYGLVSHTTGRRTHEIGIRMALGASPFRTVGLVVGQTFAISAMGIVIGVFLAGAVAQAIRSQLFGVSAADPRHALAAAAVLAAVALVASLAPALRAAQVDPLVALRNE